MRGGGFGDLCGEGREFHGELLPGGAQPEAAGIEQSRAEEAAGMWGGAGKATKRSCLKIHLENNLLTIKRGSFFDGRFASASRGASPQP